MTQFFAWDWCAINLYLSFSAAIFLVWFFFFIWQPFQKKLILKLLDDNSVAPNISHLDWFIFLSYISIFIYYNDFSPFFYSGTNKIGGEKNKQ